MKETYDYDYEEIENILDEEVEPINKPKDPWASFDGYQEDQRFHYKLGEYTDGDYACGVDDLARSSIDFG